MNQNIQICYKPDYHSNSNYWDWDWEFWFVLNRKHHRERAPSNLYSNGGWGWFIHNFLQKSGYNYDWNKE